MNPTTTQSCDNRKKTFGDVEAPSFTTSIVPQEPALSVGPPLRPFTVNVEQYCPLFAAPATRTVVTTTAGCAVLATR